MGQVSVYRCLVKLVSFKRNHLLVDANQILKNECNYSLIGRGLIKQDTLKETIILTKTPISLIKDIASGKTLSESGKRCNFQSWQSTEQDIIRRKIHALY